MTDVWTRYQNQIGIILFTLLIGAIPLFVKRPYILSIMIFIGVFTIITVGLCLLMGYAGQISLGQAAFYAIGGYSSAILTVRYGVSPWLALVAGMVLTGIVAYVIGIPILRLRGHYLAMATLAFGIAVNMLLVEFKDYTGGPTGLPGLPRLAVGSLVFDKDAEYYYVVWAAAVAVIILSLNIVNSRVGRALRSIHGSEIAADTLGVDTARYKLQVLVISAVYASIAGSLYAHYLIYVSPSAFSLNISIEVVVMAAVGGLASIWGAPFGAATVYTITPITRELMPRLLKYRSGEHQVIAYGIILVLIMIFMPEGLTTGTLNLIRRWRARRNSGVSNQ